jgi:hypothetical protein
MIIAGPGMGQYASASRGAPGPARREPGKDRVPAATSSSRRPVNRRERAALKRAVKVPGYELSDHADRSDPTLMHAFGRIAERDDRVLHVVYNASVNPPRIVTVYFDRRQRGNT